MEMQHTEQMARRRAILTDTEREIISAEEKGDRYYQAVSRIRRKINEQLLIDLALLDQYNPQLFSELESAVSEFSWQELSQPIDTELLPLTDHIIRIELVNGNSIQMVLETASWSNNSFYATGTDLVDSSIEYRLKNDEKFTPVYVYEALYEENDEMLGEVKSAFYVNNSGRE